MKKHIALLFCLGVLTLAVTSCSTTRRCHSSVNLAGDWKMGGPYHIGQVCHVLQTGAHLTFVNEMGWKSDGTLATKRSEVIAWDWEGGLTGQLTNNATRINWRNGTWWLKDR